MDFVNELFDFLLGYMLDKVERPTSVTGNDLERVENTTIVGGKPHTFMANVTDCGTGDTHPLILVFDYQFGTAYLSNGWCRVSEAFKLSYDHEPPIGREHLAGR